MITPDKKIPSKIKDLELLRRRAISELHWYLQDHPDPEYWDDFDALAYVFEIYPEYLDDAADMEPKKWRRLMMGLMRYDTNPDVLHELFRQLRENLRVAAVNKIRDMHNCGELR